MSTIAVGAAVIVGLAAICGVVVGIGVEVMIIAVGDGFSVW
jgi:hypothetical protein